MKKLFIAIRNSDLDTVREILAKKPELVACTAKQPPKKDDGQSPLQVALKTGNFDIADHLLALGADVNAKDSYGNSCLWRACLQASQILPRYNPAENKMSGERLLTEEVEADLSRIFRLLVKSGADINYVRPGIDRSVKEFYKNQTVERFLALEN